MLWEIFKKLRILFVRICLLLGDDVILNVNFFNLLVVRKFRIYEWIYKLKVKFIFILRYIRIIVLCLIFFLNWYVNDEFVVYYFSKIIGVFCMYG